jgi:hypothetical protein
MDPQRLAIDCSFHDLEIQNSKESKHPHLVARIVRGDRLLAKNAAGGSDPSPNVWR